MTHQHPITPPPELFKQWEDDILNKRDNVDHVLDCAWRDGFRAGADQELLACGNYLKHGAGWKEEDVTEFYNYRRPKPPSLKEQALETLAEMKGGFAPDLADLNLLRRALETLDD